MYVLYIHTVHTVPIISSIQISKATEIYVLFFNLIGF